MCDRKATHLKTTVGISCRIGLAPPKYCAVLLTLKKFTSNVLTPGISEHNRNWFPWADESSWPAALIWPRNSCVKYAIEIDSDLRFETTAKSIITSGVVLTALDTARANKMISLPIILCFYYKNWLSYVKIEIICEALYRVAAGSATFIL